MPRARRRRPFPIVPGFPPGPGRAPLVPLLCGFLIAAASAVPVAAEARPDSAEAKPAADAGAAGADSAAGGGHGNRGDTLDLPAARARALPPPAAAKSVLIPTDVDRRLGNLGDLLQREAGVHVMRAGGLGDYLGISLRGASESQVDVYVDGVLQNQASDAALYLSDWDLARVERVEVYKGLAPEDLPGAPLGGAINIITRGSASGGPHARASLGAGSFGAFKADGAAELSSGPWRARVQAVRDQAEGDFPYYDDGGLEYETGRHPEGARKLGPDDLVRKIRRNFEPVRAQLTK